LSYLPSASLLARPRRRADATRGSLLAVGDPSYAPERHLDPLPGAATEAAAIAALAGGEALVGEAADRDGVLTRLKGARIVHLATHASFVPEAPYSAELALAADGALRVPDLVGLDADIDLAVLSACDTGHGRATASGDLIGLTRALLGAGTRELIVSLWPVDDEIGCLTMVRLHEAVRRGRGTAQALTEAQQAVRAMTWADVDAAYADLEARSSRSGVGRPETDVGNVPAPRYPDDPSHPAYWAPFVHVGV
jgi:CHAT domain-containing protein